MFGFLPNRRNKKLVPIPKIRYAREAYKTTIQDDGDTISLYIYPLEQHPDRFVCESPVVDCLVSVVDINNKGNVQGIEVILRRRPGQKLDYFQGRG